MSTSDSQFTVDTLTSDNYGTWRSKMEAYLKVKSVWEYVDPDPVAVSLNVELGTNSSTTTTITAAEAKEQKTWRRSTLGLPHPEHDSASRESTSRPRFQSEFDI
ncbi:hypothetical protein GGU10DRAFT_337546 [Lentinula aff. detonsa]|uniref:DUF4219 domain-containing protein n=1 Tax=Lentinula aff. detonsa TaxID=2804958 RepID=A0AA38K7I6_9AGAR|nr:hypothetical protein GGU10DRAFT_337546 [Lentinula aff. detonsa]